MSPIIGQDLVAMAYSKRLATLHLAGIALWDVVGEATRTGSLDQHIRDAKPNNLQRFVQHMPCLRAVAFNGKKAVEIAGNVFDEVAIDILQLPSSSSANTQEIKAKSVVWSAISAYL